MSPLPIRPNLSLWGALLCLVFARDANAQCGANRTTCSACHDGEKAPSPRLDPWHVDHAFADLCPACHGGHGDATDIPSAHANLVAPLDDPQPQCGSCHVGVVTALAGRYRDVRAPTGARAADAGVTVGMSDGPHRPPPHGMPQTNLALAAVACALALLSVGFVVHNERGRRRRAVSLPRTGGG